MIFRQTTARTAPSRSAPEERNAVKQLRVFLRQRTDGGVVQTDALALGLRHAFQQGGFADLPRTCQEKHRECVADIPHGFLNRSFIIRMKHLNLANLNCYFRFY